ncbi:hypothetical protein MPH_07706 [Macrophomina phaseolina MS6]|uniref:Uncharacterized protein n=1 Tax=Macrophomina phaseolina (strain MS6) TaxID=1126212 RepID=K2RY56_MACPH|nr:hypothetical protein MPH_07706 [Macrophomina phaseolina MS6]
MKRSKAREAKRNKRTGTYDGPERMKGDIDRDEFEGGARTLGYFRPRCMGSKRVSPSTVATSVTTSVSRGTLSRRWEPTLANRSMLVSSGWVSYPMSNSVIGIPPRFSPR